ncbi:hypothetical protein EN871_06605 [bacterium M00.F.Ca.ET.228.01.1.1]|uniref:hypothetical protein n=1 Tax=Paraburkholderia phenoliruptrix TaxID=252970 RepID=UPI0010923544|nr:hypothetical protein [Paraburkholderia phenoliruptrix]TGP46120.1 hypothetical protein EN871_06605 [bacterium M00.F.Ca.ET.228.01.1.1]TGS03967.1 hypothetical protein EN834_06380 [bacterium M00.F.Ca.ET.191.01.1.1]TGU07413.1 hypothetical protein EN798_10680 [bacterium M00.F.Ca.ET.155.01.1.1]MBW0446664.1 hypothetical protein [Paraburkholderia phenoliruptrix]MBW9096909.1 hypothetical protein [Paraburkholderia phenoliruptrix]
MENSEIYFTIDPVTALDLTRHPDGKGFMKPASGRFFFCLKPRNLGAVMESRINRGVRDSGLLAVW